jgi:hypothetical protein
MKFKTSDLYVSPLSQMAARFPERGYVHDVYIGSWKIAEITNRKPYTSYKSEVWRITGVDGSTFKSKEHALVGLVRRLNGEVLR